MAVLTVSDTRTEKNDRSGQTLIQCLQKAGHSLGAYCIVKDELLAIQFQLKKWIGDTSIRVILMTGGTGISRRDISPEALSSLWEKEIPGFGELFRMLSYKSIGTAAIQSRACAGIAGGTLIFSLPGSPSACRDAWEGILVKQLDVRSRPCNFVQLLDSL